MGYIRGVRLRLISARNSKMDGGGMPREREREREVVCACVQFAFGWIYGRARVPDFTTAWFFLLLIFRKRL